MIKAIHPSQDIFNNIIFYLYTINPRVRKPVVRTIAKYLNMTERTLRQHYINTLIDKDLVTRRTSYRNKTYLDLTSTGKKYYRDEKMKTTNITN